MQLRISCFYFILFSFFYMYVGLLGKFLVIFSFKLPRQLSYCAEGRGIIFGLIIKVPHYMKCILENVVILPAVEERLDIYNFVVCIHITVVPARF